MLKHEISIHKLCPQTVSKHSLVHFQGVAIKFQLKFRGTSSSYASCQQMISNLLSSHVTLLISLSLPPGASRFAWLKFLAGYSQWALAQGFQMAGPTSVILVSNQILIEDFLWGEGKGWEDINYVVRCAEVSTVLSATAHSANFQVSASQTKPN